MRYILVVLVEFSPDDALKFLPLVEAKKNLESLQKQNKGFELLSNNVVLIPLKNGLGAAPAIFQAIADAAYKYQVFEGEPEWHQGPLDADIQDLKTT